MSRIGEKIRTLRQRHGLTLRALGEATGISYGYIANIESGERRPSIDVVDALSRYFDVTTDALIKDELDV